jgi:hypothetical protein
MASVAQWEAQIIGERTRVALAERRAAGVSLGRPRSVDAGTVQVIKCLALDGRSARAIAPELNCTGIPAPFAWPLAAPGRSAVSVVQRFRGPCKFLHRPLSHKLHTHHHRCDGMAQQRRISHILRSPFTHGVSS